MTGQTQMATNKKMSDKKGFDFENSLKRLKDIQAKLEEGDLSLEKSIEQFEQGSALIKECRKALEEAEQRVRILSDDDGETDPFDADQK